MEGLVSQDLRVLGDREGSGRKAKTQKAYLKIPFFF